MSPHTITQTPLYSDLFKYATKPHLGILKTLKICEGTRAGKSHKTQMTDMSFPQSKFSRNQPKKNKQKTNNRVISDRFFERNYNSGYCEEFWWPLPAVLMIEPFPGAPYLCIKAVLYALWPDPVCQTRVYLDTKHRPFIPNRGTIDLTLDCIFTVIKSSPWRLSSGTHYSVSHVLAKCLLFCYQPHVWTIGAKSGPLIYS